MKAVKKSPLLMRFLRSTRTLRKDHWPTLKALIVQHFQRHRLYYFVVAWTVVLVLGYIGFYLRLKDSDTPHSWGDLLYFTLQLFTMESGSVDGRWNWEFEVTRFVAPVLAAFSVAQALEAIIRGRLPRLKGHVVVCGAGRKGILLARAFQTCRLPVVVIEKNPGNEVLSDCPGHVIIGSATEREILEKARVDSARYVICVCGDDGENAQIASHLKEIARRRPGRHLTCFVHIVDPRLRDQLERRERASHTTDCRLYFFNILKSGARSLLYEHSPFQGLTLNAIPHLIVVGAGYLGESIIVRAAEMWRHRQGPDGFPVQITMLDTEAEKKQDLLEAQNPGLEGVWELNALPLDVRGHTFERASFLFDAEGRPVPSIVYVCLGSDSLTLSAALLLQERLSPYSIRVVACMAQDAGLASLLQNPDKTADDPLGVATFGLMDRTCQPALLFEACIEELARTFHEEWAAQQPTGAEGDGTPVVIPAWETLPEEIKESNRQQADSLIWKLQSAGYVLAPRLDPLAPPAEFASQEDIERIAQLEHERWRAERMRQGWTYGPVRDNPKKKNPLLRPWEELDPKEKEHTLLTVQGYPKLLASVDLHIHRPRRKTSRREPRIL